MWKGRRTLHGGRSPHARGRVGGGGWVGGDNLQMMTIHAGFAVNKTIV